MKIVDIDALDSLQHVSAANHFVLQSCTVLSNGEIKQNEPIKWFSREATSTEDFESRGFIAVGQFIHGKSLLDALNEMVYNIDKVASKHGMQTTKKFRARKNPVLVVTNRHFDSIEALNAIPVPPMMLLAMTTEREIKHGDL